MHKIRDWLYISNYASASLPHVIKDNKIEAMLQLYRPIKAKGLDTKFIALQDGIPIREEQLREGIDFIHQQRQKNHRILSTCGAGVSRSVTLAIVALKEIEGLSLARAYSSIHKLHPKAMPDHVHWTSISDFYGENNDFWKIWGDVTLNDMD